MVAISLYRGNLHRVPDVPRRWLMPTPKISLKDFRVLLTRRSKALTLLRSSPPTSSNPEPDPVLESECKKEPERESGGGESGCEGKLLSGREREKEIDEENVPETGNSGAELAAFEAKEDDGLGNLDAEDPDKGKLLDDNEKRKREVEDKLQVLQAKKHNLVQVLKQILNAEEQLKAKREPQLMMTGRPLASLQIDVMHDSGSMSRQVTPRMGLEANVGGGDVEAGEAEDASNQNILSRHVRRTSSLSPSSESPLRRPFQHNVPHPSRSGFVAASSPSRFAPTAHQGNPPSISLSGTNYIASSPSPAASGGTSAFRDTRQPSPWN